MRSTIHLVSARDALAIRPLLAPMLARALGGSRHGRALSGVDRAELAATARALLSAEPSTLAELGSRLAEQWRGVAPESLAQAVRADEALVQVTPRGLWGRSGPPRHTTLTHWLGDDLPADLPDDLSVDALVLRYLAAFGPASVKDVQAWSGLTRLGEVVDRLRPRLVAFTDVDGRELVDLPDAPRPSPDLPAPARLLYDFDNLLLSYDDRSRVSTPPHRAVATSANGMPPRAALVDGFTAGTWRVERVRGTATLTVVPFTRFARADRDALAAEGAARLDFLAAGESHDVRVLARPR